MFTLTNISKFYKTNSNKIDVLSDVNLSFPMSGLVAIYGKSGSGKSTLLNMLIGLLPPSKGKITYLNKDIYKLKNKNAFLNKEIGILFQHFNLFDELTCLENVILPLCLNGINKKKSSEIAKELFAKYNLSYLINQKFISLSGGEKQRVALLRAIVNNPRVILADEPTGALDSKNAIFIMDELKLLAKDHLIILVSHNMDLIDKYADYKINISNGKVSYLNEKKSEDNLIIKKKNNRQNILFSFLKIHLKKHKIRNLISGASIAFSSLCLLLSYGYISGSKDSANSYKKKSLLYNYATIAKKEIIEVKDSPIKISKLTRPNKLDIQFLNEKISSVHIENNYQSFFPSYPMFNFDNKNYEDVEFSSIYDFLPFSNLLVSGSFPIIDDLTEVVVNEEFINKFNYDSNSILNHTFRLNIEEEVTNLNNEGQLIKDDVDISLNLKIVGVVKEFSYLNAPRIYYPYLALKDIASEYILKNFSESLGFEISLDEAISYASSNEPISSYSYLIFIDDINEVDTLFSLKKEYDELETFEITSIAYTICDSYVSLTGVISTSLLVFIGIVLLGCIAIVIITSFANFTDNKKESAILYTLGSKKSTLFNIYNIENIFVSITSVLIASLLSIPFKSLVNNIIYQSFYLENLIVINLFSFVPLIFIILLLLFSLIATLIPFLFYQNGYITQELKDE